MRGSKLLKHNDNPSSQVNRLIAERSVPFCFRLKGSIMHGNNLDQCLLVLLSVNGDQACEV